MPFEIFCLHITEEIHGLTEWCLTDRAGEVVQCGLWSGGRLSLETLLRIRVEMLHLNPIGYGDWRARTRSGSGDQARMIRQAMTVERRAA